MLTILATIASIAALFGQGYDLPDKFIDGALDKGKPTINAHFVGMTWKCGGETCFSGIATRKGITFLHTGP